MIGPSGERPLLQVWDVAALLQAAADALAARFGACAVRGEISGFSRAGSGHCYFTLKDAAQGLGALRCCLFRRSAAWIDFEPRDGQLVDLRGRLDVYGARGELQFIVESMQRTGAGALYEQFLRLRSRLEGEGLFAIEEKRSLEPYPRRVGVVTSLGAAALHDVLAALARRAPHVQVVLYPSLVQGADAPGSLCAAIAQANVRAEVDTLIVCRGGGSLEDLWAFNDERVVRAIRGARMPVVCGVGHETDVTLADLAADVRAPTPTAAAELAAPARAACVEALEVRVAALRHRVGMTLDGHAQRIDRLARRLARPANVTQPLRHGLHALQHRFLLAFHQSRTVRAQRLIDRRQRLQAAMRRRLQRDIASIQREHARLDGVDPTRVLARGYALLVATDGSVVASIRQVRAGEALEARVADGRLDVSVSGIAEDSGKER